MKQEYSFKRYPYTSNTSLKAWSAADEYMLEHLEEFNKNGKKIALFNDRFGYLACNLIEYNPLFIAGYKSQEKALLNNCSLNNLVFNEKKIVHPLSKIDDELDLSLMKIPKSLDLFELHLQQLASCLTSDGIVLAGFMTRHFNKTLIEIANNYFEEVEQSKAWRKSRVLILKKPRSISFSPLLTTIDFEHSSIGHLTLKQYPGVFSSNRIDPASQFLLDHLSVAESDARILDLASGNGILGLVATRLNPEAEVHFLDDSLLAIESSKLNVNIDPSCFHYDDTLTDFERDHFDLVISNPPFHFEYETNIEVSVSLFKQVLQKLTTSGRFILVANKHLNYKTHLEPLFSNTRILSQNKKFVIYECIK